jgi:hypothetical protein
MTTHDIPNRRRSSRAAVAVGASLAVGLAVCVGLLLSDDPTASSAHAAPDYCPTPLAL